MRRTILASTVLAGLTLGILAPAAQAQIDIYISLAPPELPIYEQPPIPGPGYIWTPGYWAYAPEGYYWVPATWVMPPSRDMLWTPGYWRFGPRGYVWNPGYWGTEVGYYGGIYYGYGYNGSGYGGGYWENHAFYYNRAANNFGSVRMAHEYDRPIGRDDRGERRTSFNGGTGGVMTQPTERESAYGRANHTPPVAVQMQHERAAGGDRGSFQSNNHGQPPVAATSRPHQIGDGGRPDARPATEPREAAPVQREAAPGPREEPPARRDEPQRLQAVPEFRAGEPAPHPQPTEPRQAEPQQHPAAPPQRQEQPQHRAAPAPRAAEPQQRQAEPQQRGGPPAQHEREREDRK